MFVKSLIATTLLACVASATKDAAKGWVHTHKWVADPAAAAKCVNTPGWTNGDAYKHPCANYAKVWCDAGKARAGSEWTLGAKWNFPEKNCCVCGKAAFDAKAAKAKAAAAAAAAVVHHHEVSHSHHSHVDVSSSGGFHHSSGISAATSSANGHMHISHMNSKVVRHEHHVGGVGMFANMSFLDNRDAFAEAERA